MCLATLAAICKVSYTPLITPSTEPRPLCLFLFLLFCRRRRRFMLDTEPLSDCARVIYLFDSVVSSSSLVSVVVPFGVQRAVNDKPNDKRQDIGKVLPLDVDGDAHHAAHGDQDHGSQPEPIVTSSSLFPIQIISNPLLHRRARPT